MLGLLVTLAVYPLALARMTAALAWRLAQALVRYGRHDESCPAVTLEDPACDCGLTPLVRDAKRST